MKRPRVFITVNPDLIAGKRVQTVRSMVTALDKICDLFVIPIDAIDFVKGHVRAFRRTKGGKFKSQGRIEIKADLWIVYTDGYYLNVGNRMGYIRRQLRFYEELVETGAVSHVVNLPEAERRTLKDWFAKLDCERLKIIPTFTVKTSGELREAVRKHKRVVVKPIWGGASEGVVKVDSHSDVSDINLDECVYQLYREGDEKRLWFVGNECVGGRIVKGRKTPWSPQRNDHRGQRYDRGKIFERDREVAQRVWDMSLLAIGCVDFIGDEINEINGCGTTFVYYDGWTKIADVRPALVDYVTQLVINLSK